MSGKGHPILTVIVILAAVGFFLGLVMTLFFSMVGSSEALSFKEKIGVLPSKGPSRNQTPWSRNWLSSGKTAGSRRSSCESTRPAAA